MIKSDFTGWEYVAAPHRSENDLPLYWRVVERHFRLHERTPIYVPTIEWVDWRVHPQAEC
jgi:hypothetical protein